MSDNNLQTLEQLEEQVATLTKALCRLRTIAEKGSFGAQGVFLITEVNTALTAVREAEQSNVVELKVALQGMLLMLYNGTVTYSEFLKWILYNIPAPGVDPLSSEVPAATSTIYRCVYAAVQTAHDLEELEARIDSLAKGS